MLLTRLASKALRQACLLPLRPLQAEALLQLGVPEAGVDGAPEGAELVYYYDLLCIMLYYIVILLHYIILYSCYYYLFCVFRIYPLELLGV